MGAWKFPVAGAGGAGALWCDVAFTALTKQRRVATEGGDTHLAQTAQHCGLTGLLK